MYHDIIAFLISDMLCSFGKLTTQSWRQALHKTLNFNPQSRNPAPWLASALGIPRPQTAYSRRHTVVYQRSWLIEHIGVELTFGIILVLDRDAFVGEMIVIPWSHAKKK